MHSVLVDEFMMLYLTVTIYHITIRHNKSQKDLLQRLSIILFITFVYPSLHLSNAFNLNHSSLARRQCLEARSRWHRLGQKVDVNLVHSREVLHVREVDIVLDHLLK